MTMPASAKGLGGRLPSELERETANQLRRLLALQASGEANLRVLDDEGKVVDITLAPAISNLLMEVLRPIGRGDAVTLVPVSQMLTTQQAADILNVSRPFLISLLEKGEIPFDPVGRHRRIRAEDLFAYKAARDKRRSEALSELAAMDGELLQLVFANRFTAMIDACVLAGVLRRNLILTLAQCEFFRVRWSDEILGETERAIAAMYTRKGDTRAAEKAAASREKMAKAFEDAMVSDYGRYLPLCQGIDADDAHVIAAAMKTQAQVIVTDNLKHFPRSLLEPLNLEARSADTFIADTIALDIGRAVAAIREMRQRLERPAMTASDLLVMMDANGLTAAVNILQPHEASL